MPLHRDIFWIGRQWAVTGFGIQAVDQRLKGAFDIKAARLWDDDLPRRMRALSWLNAADFAEALEHAHTRFPAPAGKKPASLVDSVLEMLQPVGLEPTKGLSSQPRAASAKPEPVKAVPPPTAPATIDVKPLKIESTSSEVRPLEMKIEQASAQFLPNWRIRH